MSETLKCGHPKALWITSTESEYAFCELCEVRSERDDAHMMERHYGDRARALSEALTETPTAEEMEAALDAASIEVRRRHSGARGQQLYMEDGSDYQLVAAFLRLRLRAALSKVSQQQGTPQAQGAQDSEAKS